MNNFTYDIEKTLGVVGGDAWIRRTRIPVWALEGDRRLGVSDVQLLEHFPMLKTMDLANVWAYVIAHRDEIEQAIRDTEGSRFSWSSATDSSSDYDA